MSSRPQTRRKKGFRNRLLGMLVAVCFLVSNIPLQITAQQMPATHNGASAFGNGLSVESRLGGKSFGFKETNKREPTQVGSQLSTPSSGGGMGGLARIEGPRYQIHVLGEVEKPDIYRVAASTRLSEAIQATGGILDRGSSRRIQLRRNDTIRTIDLLLYKQNGNLQHNPYLVDNDVIFVPLKALISQIVGAVKRPGEYELGSNASLYDLIQLGGGFAPGSSKEKALKLIRHNGGEKSLISIPQNEDIWKEFLLESADVLYVPHIFTETTEFDYNLAKLPGDAEIFYPSFEERVFVIGAVNLPGPQPYSTYYGLRQYLSLAGGMTKLAKSHKIQVISSTGMVRESAKLTESVSPGDTIVVPEHYLRPENWLTLVLGISSTILGLTTTILTLSR